MRGRSDRLLSVLRLNLSLERNPRSVTQLSFKAVSSVRWRVDSQDGTVKLISVA